MTQFLLTQYNGKILGPIAKLLGYLMNGIYLFWDNLFHVQNIGLCIITFTVIIYLCMLPLTIKQQRFSKLNQVMSPELKKIQAKYKNKKDSASQMAMQEETQELYDKYGVSPMGSCLQLAIQIPILWSLYRVIYNVPAYVPHIKETFKDLVEAIMATDGYQDKITKLFDSVSIRNVKLDFETATTTYDSIIDVIYKLPTQGWDVLRGSFGSLTDLINTTYASVQQFNSFLGVNISESPWNLIKSGFSAGTPLVVLIAILIPVLSAATQLLNIKLTQTSTSMGVGTDAMARQMKTMNMFMPIFSLIMVFSLPVGVGIYWIAGAVIRTILQLLINIHLSKIDFEKLIEKNKEKAALKAKKRKEKRGVYENQIRNSASMKTRNIDTSKIDNKKGNGSTYVENAKAGSLASKANMVRDFNNKKNK